MPSRVEIDKVSLNNIENRIKGKPDYYRGFASYMLTGSPKTTIKYLVAINAMESYLKKSALDINMDDLNLFFAWIKNGKDSGKPASQSQIQVTYYGINKFFGYMFKSGRIEKNPMDNIDAPKQKDRIDNREVPEEWALRKIMDELQLNAEALMYRLELMGSTLAQVRDSKNPDVRQLFRDIKKHTLRWAVLATYITTGIRSIEVRSIDLEDLDFDNRTFKVIAKGENEREIYFGEKLESALEMWLAVRENMPNVTSPALFVNTLGNRLGMTYTKDVLNELLKELGLENLGITPHRLRAAYGTNLYEKTRDIYFVQSCMGHASPRTTEIYAKHRENPTKQGSSIIEDMLFG